MRKVTSLCDLQVLYLRHLSQYPEDRSVVVIEGTRRGNARGT